jgi:hypothetical protein
MRALKEEWLSCLARNYKAAWQVLNNKSLDKAAARFGVDSTTIRAMPTGNDRVTPSSIFSSWAKSADEKLGITGTTGNCTFRPTETSGALIERFESWHAQIAEDLAERWEVTMKDVQPGTRINAAGDSYERAQCKTLSTAHKFKLVDLYVRSLRFRFPENSQAHAAVIQQGHIPLDKKSIAVIEAFRGGAPRKTTMGYITSDGMYQDYQGYASQIALEVTVPDCMKRSKLVLDTFCWHHPKAQGLYEKDTARISPLSHGFVE